MPDAETSGGKTPIDVQMWLINIGRTDIQAGLLPAVFHTDLAVDNSKMRRFIHVESIQKEFVFNSGSH